jgi:hypothetical protein
MRAVDRQGGAATAADLDLARNRAQGQAAGPGGWASYFEQLLKTIGSRERETGLEPTRGTTWNGKRILSLSS